MPTKSTSTGRQANKRAEIFEAAVALFLEHGYDATSMRDIASAVGVMPASIYYHYPSKEELLIDVVTDGARLLDESVVAALADETDPWARLERACAAHLTTLLHGPAVVRVLYVELQRRREGRVDEDLLRIRRAYEQRFRDLVDALPLADGVNRSYLRLTLLGAMAWSPVWYSPTGDDPGQIGHELVSLLRDGASGRVSGSGTAGTVTGAPGVS